MLSYIFVSVQNRRQFCNLRGIFNALNKVLCLASTMECAEGDNKIVFTSPEAMVEFSGGKNKTSVLVKTL